MNFSTSELLNIRLEVGKGGLSQHSTRSGGSHSLIGCLKSIRRWMERVRLKARPHGAASIIECDCLPFLYISHQKWLIAIGLRFGKATSSYERYLGPLACLSSILEIIYSNWHNSGVNLTCLMCSSLDVSMSWMMQQSWSWMNSSLLAELWLSLSKKKKESTSDVTRSLQNLLKVNTPKRGAELSLRWTMPLRLLAPNSNLWERR